MFLSTILLKRTSNRFKTRYCDLDVPETIKNSENPLVQRLLSQKFSMRKQLIKQMGRQASYKRPLNITKVTNMNNYRVGYCRRCHKWIKSKLWGQHHHDGFFAQLQNLSLRCSKKIMQLGKVIQQSKQEWIDHSSSIKQFQLQFQTSFKKLLNKLTQSVPQCIKDTPKTKKIRKDGLVKALSSEKVKIYGAHRGVQTGSNRTQSFKKIEISESQTTLELPSALEKWQLLKTSKSLNELNKIKKNFKKDISSILKTCGQCELKIFTTKGPKMECQFCRTLYHVECVPDHCYCADCFRSALSFPDTKNSQNDLLNYLTQAKPVKNLQIALQNDIQVQGYPVTPQSLANQEDIKQLLLKQYNLLYTRQALFYECNSPNLLDDPLLEKASPSLTQAYIDYVEGKSMICVVVKKTKATGNGVYAMKKIPKGTILCQYAADVIPMSCAHTIPYANYSMEYSQGPNGLKELVLTPINCANWSILMNHSVKRSNCKNLRVIIDGVIRIIFFSTRVINCGEQLMYNYNGSKKEFQTQKLK